MIIFPAIDIIAGHCVRLTQGDFAQKTVYSDNPAAMALNWQAQGAQYLHLVDLDGALAGASKNLNVVKEILAAVNIPVQLGGGIRDLKTIEHLLSQGLSRVILGSIAVKDPELVRQAVREFGSEQIVVGIDSKDGMVAVHGWGETSSLSAVELGKHMLAAGVVRTIFTDIARDGKLGGVNIEATCDMAKQTGLQVIASGGVSDIEDIRQLKSVATQGIEGVIVGKAIYDKRLDLSEAIAVAQG